MKKERIDIVINEKRIDEDALNTELVEATERLEKTDRIPVQLNLNQWTLLAARGISFGE